MKKVFRFRPRDGYLFLTSYIGDDEIVRIPATYNGTPVTAITRECFCKYDNCNIIKKIILPDSIKLIESEAFAYCSNLKEVVLSENLEVIKQLAFCNCASLKEITLPPNLEKIGSGCFWGCKSLKKVVAQSKNISVGKDAFKWGIPLEDVSLHFIGKLDPKYQIKLTKNLLKKSDTLTKGEEKELISFINKKQNLKKELFLQEDNEIIAWLISHKVKLTLGVLNQIIDYYIQKQDTITNAMLLDYKNKNFSNSEVLEQNERKDLIEIGFEQPSYADFKQQWTFTKRNGEITIYSYKGLAKEQTIPDRISDGTPITQIEHNDNSNFTKLEVLRIQANLNEIKYYCFQRCINLKEIILPDSLTYIGNGAFNDCTSLTQITIPEKIARINSYTFENCTNLKEVILPKNLTSIEYEAFKGCQKLNKIDLPNQLKSIGNSTFESCEDLKEITIPKKVSKLGDSAFKHCINLEKVVIEGNIKSLNMSTFAYCSSLKEVTLPSTLTEIDAFTFCGCTSLKELTIPANVTTIGYKAFDNCTSLKQVNFLGNVIDLDDDSIKINKISK